MKEVKVEGKSPVSIAREDILRHLVERGGFSTTEELKREALDSLLNDALQQLKEDGMVAEQGEGVKLLEKGWEEGNGILRKYKKAEKELGSHIYAHVLEHFDMEIDYVLDVIKKGRTTRLSDLDEGSEAIILFPEKVDPKLISRLIGIGLTPGSMIRVFSKNLKVIVIMVKGRLAALNDKVAKMIKVLRMEAGREGDGA